MEKFAKQNLNKMLIILVIGLVVLLYFQSSQGKKEELSNNIKCQQDGFKLFEKDKEELRNYESYNSAPKFKFIKELNTCLYAGVLYSDLPASYASYYFIKDVYTNIEIASKDNFNMKDGSKSKNITNIGYYNDLYYKYFIK